MRWWGGGGLQGTQPGIDGGAAGRTRLGSMAKTAPRVAPLAPPTPRSLDLGACGGWRSAGGSLLPLPVALVVLLLLLLPPPPSRLPLPLPPPLLLLSEAEQRSCTRCTLRHAAGVGPSRGPRWLPQRGQEQGARQGAAAAATAAAAQRRLHPVACGVCSSQLGPPARLPAAGGGVGRP